MPIPPPMEFVHLCTLCGWSRPAAYAAIPASERCERCSCSLSSLRRSELPPPEVSEVDALEAALPRIGPAGALAARLAAGALLLGTAAYAGYLEGGPAMAVAALGAVGLGSVPLLVPREL